VLIFFLIYVALCLYNTGNNWSLQAVHYPLYALVGADTFGACMARQNKLEAAPAILPAAAQFMMGFVLLGVRPAGVPLWAIVPGVALNVIRAPDGPPPPPDLHGRMFWAAGLGERTHGRRGE
jgi:hypothetical protein